MEPRPLGPHSSTKQQPSTSSKPSSQNNMSALAIQAPLPIPTFRREHQWEPIRSSGPQLPRLDTAGVLPSIRELVPDHILNSQPPKETAAPSRPATIPSPSAVTPVSQTSPRYVHTPHEQLKRRRSSIEDEAELERARQVPRLYNPSAEPSPYPRRESPPTSSRSDGYFNEVLARPPPAASRPPHEPEARHHYQSQPPHQAAAAAAAPPPMSTLTAPKRVFDRDAPPPSYRPEPHSAGPEPFHRRAPPPPPPPSSHHTRTPSYEQQGAYRTGSVDYGYPPYQPSAGAPRYASAAPPSAYERSPFAAPPYASHHHYSEYARYGDGMGPVDTGKQRKRRGNLPKETTDKLRAWFLAHLGHPYPTEDEKQELMRQTGLQMNQISNWFINARRRQLPTMINDARAESDATNGRVHPKPESNGYEHREHPDHHSDSDRYEDHRYAKRGSA